MHCLMLLEWYHSAFLHLKAESMKHPELKSEIFLCVDENQAFWGREFARVFSKYEVQILRVLYNVIPNDNHRLRLLLVGAGKGTVRLKRG